MHSGGDTILDTGGIGQNDPINNVLSYIAGFADLPPGTYDIEHNGAMYFSYLLNGATGPLLISSSDPTAGITTSSFTISADTGMMCATLLYADSTNCDPGAEQLRSAWLGSARGCRLDASPYGCVSFWR